MTMALSTTELKHQLRKTDFPYCAREALGRVELLYFPHGIGRPQSSKHVDLASEFMSEFVFCEVDRRGSRKRRLNYIQELQLLEVFCDYFNFAGCGNQALRNAMILILFPPSLPDRCRLLAKLVSLAISTKNVPVLNATGFWIQTLGITSQASLELARVLVKDYFVLVPRAGSGLQDLPDVVPHFTASFLTAVAEIYTCDSAASAPPESLLEVVTQWVTDVPLLCAAAILPDAPPGSCHSSLYTSLFRWTILAPLSTQLDSMTVLYLRLHLALLESLMECRRAQVARLEGSANVQPLVEAVKVVVRPGWLAANQQIAVDRLAQALQLILVTQILAPASKQELWEHLKTLPGNRLLHIVMRQHQHLP